MVHQFVYEHQLRKEEETATIYEQRLEIGMTPSNEPYEMLMVHKHFLESVKHTLVGDYNIGNIHELFDGLQFAYHKDLNENFDLMVGCMLARNRLQHGSIATYEKEYLAYRRKDKRPFFRSSLRYHQTIFNKTIRLSALKELY